MREDGKKNMTKQLKKSSRHVFSSSFLHPTFWITQRLLPKNFLIWNKYFKKSYACKNCFIFVRNLNRLW